MSTTMTERDDFRGLVITDEANEFDRHVPALPSESEPSAGRSFTMARS